MWMEWVSTLLNLLGMLVFITIYALIFALVYVKVLGNSFNKAKFKAAKDTGKVTFNDVLGVDEAKREASEIVDFLKRPDAFQAIGAKCPKGLLMIGPPGTGKTLMAKAIANEAGVPFFSLSGADFNEVFVGVGASRIRKLYAEARKHKAAIVFIDEIDALARARSTNMFGGQESNNTLNAFLVELDGFGREGSTIITIGATNMAESLDAALLRPGRFDRQLYVGLPSLDGRKQIIDHYLAKVKADGALDTVALARATAGMSGAELSAMVNEASIVAVRDGRQRVRPNDFTTAIERMGLGQVQAKTINDHERKVIAYHEAGHAVVNFFNHPSKKLHKVSIIPTGRSALGYTWSVNTEDRHLTSREEFLAEIACLYGGRLAEEMVFGSSLVTSGASSDLKRAAKIAEMMVWDLGYAPGYPGSYRELTIAEATRRDLDLAVGVLLEEGQALARATLHARFAELESLTQALLSREVLYEPEIVELFGQDSAIRLPGAEGEHAA